MDLLNLFGFLNVYGLIFVVIMIIPNAIFAKIRGYKDFINKFPNRAMLYIDRTGIYCSVFLMAANLGVLEKGFTAEIMFQFWLAVTSVLTAIYVILWIFYFKTESKRISLMLTAVSAIIFMLSGLLQVKTLLLTFGIVYLIGQFYVTFKYDDYKRTTD